MLSTIVGPITPVQSGGGDSWVWALVAVVMVLAFLTVTWYAGLWGSFSRGTKNEPEVPSHTLSHQEKKAA
jgi:hypothetical protein